MPTSAYSTKTEGETEQKRHRGKDRGTDREEETYMERWKKIDIGMRHERRERIPKIDVRETGGESQKQEK